MNFLANILAYIGGAIASTGSNACLMMILDEPECPESLIK